jgi:hypothetical protein
VELYSSGRFLVVVPPRQWQRHNSEAEVQAVHGAATRSSEVGDERWHSGDWAAMAGVSCSAKERGRERKEWGGWPTSTVLRG